MLYRSKPLISTILTAMILPVMVYAGSLDKYGGSSREQVPPSFYQQAPQTQQRISPYEQQIQNALAILAGMSSPEQQRMLQEFRARRDDASNNGRLDEAHYYNEVITRWNARQP